MTYLEYHLLFNIPVLALLLWIVRDRLTVIHLKWIGIVCLIVVAFAFPWDNWAVGEGLWSFGDDRVIARLDNLPIEEVAFFLFETVLVSLVTILFLPREPGIARKERD